MEQFIPQSGLNYQNSGVSFCFLLGDVVSKDPPCRVGRGNALFKMPKFRSMRVDTPAVATHLLNDPDAYLSPVGAFLRRSSLDELPQLWSILKGI